VGSYLTALQAPIMPLGAIYGLYVRNYGYFFLEQAERERERTLFATEI